MRTLDFACDIGSLAISVLNPSETEIARFFFHNNYGDGLFELSIATSFSEAGESSDWEFLESFKVSRSGMVYICEYDCEPIDTVHEKERFLEPGHWFVYYAADRSGNMLMRKT